MVEKQVGDSGGAASRERRIRVLTVMALAVGACTLIPTGPAAATEEPAAPTFNNCTSSEQATVAAVFDATQTMVRQSLQALRTAASPSQAPEYLQWFGAYDAARYATVQHNFAAIDTFLTTKTLAGIPWNCNVDCPGPSVYAFVGASDPTHTVTLCGAFFFDTFSQPGTLVHEISHFDTVASTLDLVYGRIDARSLAITNPAQAITNADSYQFFAESRGSSMGPVRTVDVSDANVVEGDAGTTSIGFSVALSAPAGPGGVTFEVSTTAETAISPGDFTAVAPDSFVIAEGESVAEVVIDVAGDVVAETDETFTIALTKADGAVISDGTATGTIVNDDSAGVVVSGAGPGGAALETTESGGDVTFHVALTSEPTADVEIGYVADASEVSVTSAPLRFTAANWSDPQDVTIVGVDDGVADGDQAVEIALTIDSIDPFYDGLAAAGLHVTNVDDGDSSAPDTAIEAPPSYVDQRVATLAFTSDRPGVFDCSTDGAAAVPCTSPLELSGLADGAHSIVVTAIDSLGRRDPTPATAAWTVDTAPPVVALVNLPPASFYFGSNPSTPTCTATDALSGLVSPCTVTGGGATVGAHAWTATAMDRAGNTAIATFNYDVRPWSLIGGTQPIETNGTWNTIKGGSTVVLKFEVFAATELKSLTAIGATFTVRTVNCSTGAPVALVTGDNSLKYDTASGEFAQSWKTPNGAGVCYSATITTADGSSLSARFRTK